VAELRGIYEKSDSLLATERFILTLSTIAARALSVSVKRKSVMLYKQSPQNSEFKAC